MNQKEFNNLNSQLEFAFKHCRTIGGHRLHNSMTRQYSSLSRFFDIETAAESISYNCTVPLFINGVYEECDAEITFYRNRTRPTISTIGWRIGLNL